MPRHILAESEIHPDIRETIAAKHRDIVEEVQKAVTEHDVVVVGMAMNPYPRKARRLLERRAVPFFYIEHGSYLGEWRRRNALKMWTGWPTFPMIFVKGIFVGGTEDLAKLAKSGELDRMLGRSASPSA